MATRFVVTRHWHIPEVMRSTQSIWPQLAATEGLLGYGLDAPMGRRTLSTLTVWRDRDALIGFVRSQPHADVVKRTRQRLADSAFANWTALGAELPPSWETARRRLLLAATVR